MRVNNRRDAILALLSRYWAEGKPFPSIREIAREVGLKSQSTVSLHLDRLEIQGFLSRAGERASRAYRIRVPLLPRRVKGKVTGYYYEVWRAP